MSKDLVVLCDTCGKDITKTGNAVDWRVGLVNVRIPARGGVLTEVDVRPQLTEDKDFCSLTCTRDWINSVK